MNPLQRSLLLPLFLGACLPSTAGFLRVPVQFDAPPTGGPIQVTAEFDKIRALMPDFDPAAAAFYGRGRTALPFRLVDADGDGNDDAVTVVLESRADAEAWLVIVCPGPKANGKLLEFGNPRRVTLDFAKARR